MEQFDNYEALTKQVMKADMDFMEQYEDDEDGTTAIFSIVDVKEELGEKKYKIVCGNIGDSRVVLGRNGEAFGLTDDHKPTNIEEKSRIEAAGGFVEANRVKGTLALSRAIGDRTYKIPKNFPQDKQQVICIPDYKSIVVENNDFLLLACDGIYEQDIFSRETVIEYVQEKLNKKEDLANILADLLDNVLKEEVKII